MKKIKLLAILYIGIFSILYSFYSIFNLSWSIFDDHSTLSILIGALLFISVLIFISTSKKDN